ncbi:MAG TPA: hypothetical protein VFF74_09860 [Methylophilaceae bacterium]|nr:hypothetical protein [Methylophilaceae bacterium]
MTKLSEYIEIAAAAYFYEIGETDLEARWLAEFFQDSGVQDEYPHLDVVNFFNLVQKQLNKDAARAAQEARMQVRKIMRPLKQQRKTRTPKL